MVLTADTLLVMVRQHAVPAPHCAFFELLSKHESIQSFLSFKPWQDLTMAALASIHDDQVSVHTEDSQHSWCIMHDASQHEVLSQFRIQSTYSCNSKPVPLSTPLLVRDADCSPPLQIKTRANVIQQLQVGLEDNVVTSNTLATALVPAPHISYSPGCVDPVEGSLQDLDWP